MIYVPDLNYECYYVQGEGVIRAYEEMPENNKTINYRDYYINSNYIYKDGYTQFNSYSTLPTCLDSNIITNEFYYRRDIADIMIVFLIMSIFVFYIPYKVIICRFFRRFN